MPVPRGTEAPSSSYTIVRKKQRYVAVLSLPTGLCYYWESGPGQLRHRPS